jgi:hypothetical protein
VLYFGVSGIDPFFLGKTKLRNEIVKIGGSLRKFSGGFLQIHGAPRGIMADAGNGTDIFGYVAGRFCGACQAGGHLIGAGRLLFENAAGLATCNPTTGPVPCWSVVMDNFSFETNRRRPANVNKLYSGDRTPGGIRP